MNLYIVDVVAAYVIVGAAVVVVGERTLARIRMRMNITAFTISQSSFLLYRHVISTMSNAGNRRPI